MNRIKIIISFAFLLIVSTCTVSCINNQGESNLLSDMILGIQYPDLPPEPDSILNNTTLEGIDANKNGVRDDIERWIYRQFPWKKDDRKRKSLLQFARAKQQGLIHYENRERSIYWTRKLFDSRYCVLSHLERDKAYELTDIILFKYENTEQRVNASIIGDINFGGQGYTLPHRSERPKLCEF